MELKQAVQERKMTRGFLAKPVPPKTIKSILSLAGCAPSWGNTQPWSTRTRRHQPIAIAVGVSP